MMELFLVVKREGNLYKMLLGRFRIEVKKRKFPQRVSLLCNRSPRGTLDQPMDLNFKGKSVSMGKNQ